MKGLMMTYQMAKNEEQKKVKRVYQNFLLQYLQRKQDKNALQKEKSSRSFFQKRLKREKEEREEEKIAWYVEKSDQLWEADSSYIYKSIMYEVNVFAEYEGINGDWDISRRIKALEFFMLLIRQDLKTEIAYKKAYCLEEGSISISPFFLYPYQEDDQEGEAYINIQADMLVPYWNTDRLLEAVANLSDKVFSYDEHNHRAAYFKEIDLLVVECGFHSLHYSHFSKKEGKIKARVISLKRLFDEVDTDGVYWYRKGTTEYYDSTRKEVVDVRLAVLFEIARKIEQLKEENTIKESLEVAFTNT